MIKMCVFCLFVCLLSLMWGFVSLLNYAICKYSERVFKIIC